MSIIHHSLLFFILLNFSANNYVPVILHEIGIWLFVGRSLAIVYWICAVEVETWLSFCHNKSGLTARFVHSWI